MDREQEPGCIGLHWGQLHRWIGDSGIGSRSTSGWVARSRNILGTVALADGGQEHLHVFVGSGFFLLSM